MIIKNPNNLPTIEISKLEFTQGDLKDLTEENYNKLKRSIDKHGFIFPLAVWSDGEKFWLLDGHQRIRLAQQENWTDPLPYIEIPADSLEDATEILLKITSQYGTITQEGLDEYLAKYQLSDEVLKDIHFDRIYVDDIDEEYIDDSPYTGKVETPVYTPKDEKPEVSDLYDKNKTNELIENIERSNVDDKIKDFLRLASYRHVKFDYSKIADFYASSDKEVQELIEQSALVIIDFDSAIENGFVRLSEEIAKQYTQDA